jgi:hypothetical protein
MPKPFNMLRACFWLLAAIILVLLFEGSLGIVACAYLTMTERQEIGNCLKAGVVDHIREILELALTTVLALLLADRNKNPPDKDDDDAK